MTQRRSVYEELRDLILSGRLAPGTRLIGTELADRLDASRPAIHTALGRLELEGYLGSSNSASQVRFHVAPLTADDAEELFGIVAEIEGLAARWAAGKNAERRADLVERLRVIDAALLDASRQPSPDPGSIFDFYTEFHRAYVEVGAGPRLLALHDMVKPQAERYRRLYSSSLARQMEESLREHEAIISGFEEGDPDAAQLAVQTNWRNAAQRLRAVIETFGERGAW